jgi:hypothetical protein
LPTSIQETFCPAVFAELLASVEDHYAQGLPLLIGFEGSDAFSTAYFKIAEMPTSYIHIDISVNKVRRELMKRDPSRINSYLLKLIIEITEATNENAILADQTLQRFLSAEKRIQEILHDLNGQTSELTLKLSTKLRNQWQNLTSFFQDFKELASSANSKWQNVRGRVETVVKDPSHLKNETVDEIIKLFEAAEYDLSNMNKVKDMYLDISIRSLPNLHDKDQRYIEEVAGRLWNECEQSSNSYMALMTSLQLAATRS